MSEIGQKLIAAVRNAASENPEFIYPQPGGMCYYVHEGQPSCIVGQGLWAIGLIDAEFETSQDNDNGVTPMACALELDLSDEELDWLNAAQHAQDTGQSWGRAIGLADAKASLYQIANSA